MEHIFIKVVNMGIAAGWLILAVMLLRFIFRKMQKGIHCILWGFVGIRLICSYSPKTILSLIPSAQTISPDICGQQEPNIHSGIAVLNQTVNPILSESFAPDISAGINPLQVWVFIASVIWAAGMVLMTIYAVFSYLRLYRKVRESVKWEDNLYFCDYIDTPFILGVVCPKIYFPSAMEDKQIDYVKFHEKAHLKRYDHFWKLVGFILLTVYWFHPLCWAAYWAFCKDLELACDEKVIRDFDAHRRKEYSRALLECSVNHHRIAAYPLAFGEVNVKERIKNVLNYKKPSFWTAPIAVVVCVIVAVCFLTNPREEVQSVSDLFGYSYVVDDVTYYAPIYSYSFPPEASLAYCLTEDYKLMEKEENSQEYNVLGNAEEITLNYDNFDQYIAGFIPLDMIKETSAMLRKENDKTWQVDSAKGTEDEFYYILQQKNGDVYLCYGYNYASQKDTSGIGWIFKLEKNGSDE